METTIATSTSEPAHESQATFAPTTDPSILLVRRLLLELAPTQVIKELKPTHHLVNDLEYHSLALMELAFTLEDELGLAQLDQSVIEAIKTAGDVEAHVIKELERKRAPKAVSA